jgi:hypothetical protein
VGTIAPKWRSPIYLSRAQQADAGHEATQRARPGQTEQAAGCADTEVGLELLGSIGVSSRSVARIASHGRVVDSGGLRRRLLRRTGTTTSETPKTSPAASPPSSNRSVIWVLGWRNR